MTDVWNLLISDGHGGITTLPLDIDLVGQGTTTTTTPGP